MKLGSTLFLKSVVMLISLIVLTLCIFALPAGIRSDTAGMYRPLLIGMYFPAIPFFLGIIHTFKLLNLIDAGRAFSQAAINSLRSLKFMTLLISGMYALGLPYIYQVADRDDAPGVMLLGLIFTFAPLMMAILAAVLQRMFEDALQLKATSELTI